MMGNKKYNIWTKEIGLIQTDEMIPGMREFQWHREDGPAIIRYNDNGDIITEEYWLNDVRHREDGPACIKYCELGNILIEEYFYNGVRVREDGPSVIRYFTDGAICDIQWRRPFQNSAGKQGVGLHRLDGPALVMYNPTGSVVGEYYYFAGKEIPKQVIDSLLQGEPMNSIVGQILIKLHLSK